MKQNKRVELLLIVLMSFIVFIVTLSIYSWIVNNHTIITYFPCAPEKSFVNGNPFGLSGGYMPSLDKIFIIKNSTNILEVKKDADLTKYTLFQRTIIRHERCHQNQAYNNRSYNEIECYFKQIFGGEK